MALNPNIILAGGPGIDFVGSMERGRLAAQGQIDRNNQNAFTAATRQYGAGAANGDQAAMNALAAYSPEMVQGMQANRLGMENTRLGMQQTQQNMGFRAEEMQMARDQAKAAAAQAAAQMTADERAAEVANGERVLAGLTQAQTAEQWDRMATQLGQPELVGAFDDRNIIFAMSEGAREALTTMADLAPKPDADRYQPVGGQIWDMRPDGGGAPTLVGGGTQETIYGPDGAPIVSRGPAGSARPFTEGQSKDIVFATRAQGALDTLEPVAGKLIERADIAAGYVPFGLGKGLQDADYQVARQAADEFLQAILRKDTGAAITADEQALYGVTYLPQPGDGPEVLQAKSAARKRAIAAIEAGMSASQIIAQERALAATGGPNDADGNSGLQPAVLSPNAQPVMPPFAAANGVTPDEWADMTDEEKRVWQQ